MRMINREIVSALIFSKDGKILMGKKDPAKGGVYADCWHLPGGGVDQGEDKISALIREVKEETNIDIAKLEIKLADDGGFGQSKKTLKENGEKVVCEMHFNVYKVKMLENAEEVRLTPTDDLVILRWFDKKELNTIKLALPSVKLFERIACF